MYRSSSRWPLAALGFVAAGLLLATACTPQTMTEQPRYDTYAGSAFFADNGAARPIPPEAVPRNTDRTDAHRVAGKVDDQFVTNMPYPVTEDMLNTGQKNYDIYCAVCHGYRGNGGGLVAQRGFQGVRSLNTDQARNYPLGQLYEIISNGRGVMPPYGHLMSVDDRWAVVAYVKALQLSQNATLDDVPPDQRSQLQAGGSQ